MRVCSEEQPVTYQEIVMVLTVIRDKMVIGERHMVSGLEQQSTVLMWDCAVDKYDPEVWWLWPSVHDEPGAMIHCGSIMIYSGKKSNGYGGRTLEFPTKNGVVKIQGPWHSNTDALYSRTGVDLKDKHRTYGVISFTRGMEGNNTVLLNILYCDPEGGIVGLFDRINLLAQQMADDNNTVLICYRQSSSGSSEGPVYPSNWDDKQIREYWTTFTKKR